ncbi:hypothetical protein NPIL_552411 [Nephila pilipes]|uniref:Uncharacterized protein n=1 Tax=Nephila pilipes TaxID=299642 RepID=A0A8X6Q4X5_NEPPI|nr:hypothetical protein NPIL_552411 [Nephila pilipes]
MEGGSVRDDCLPSSSSISLSFSGQEERFPDTPDYPDRKARIPTKPSETAGYAGEHQSSCPLPEGLPPPHFAHRWTLDTVLGPNLRSNRVQSMYRDPRGFHTQLQETANQEKGFSRRYSPRSLPRVYRMASVPHNEDMRIF